MNKGLLSILITSYMCFGCASTPTVDDILTKSNTRNIEVVTCPKTTIKVCNGPDKTTIVKFEKLYCSCHKKAFVERALNQQLRRERF